MSKKSPDKPIEVRVHINDVPGAGSIWIEEMAKFLVEKAKERSKLNLDDK